MTQPETQDQINLGYVIERVKRLEEGNRQNFLRVKALEEKLVQREIDFGLTLENLKANQKLYISRHKTYGEMFDNLNKQISLIKHKIT